MYSSTVSKAFRHGIDGLAVTSYRLVVASMDLRKLELVSDFWGRAVGGGGGGVPCISEAIGWIALCP